MSFVPDLPGPDGGSAPILRIWVGIEHVRPRIWRRLEVPADIRLGELHDVLQVAFGWPDVHLHVFSTGFGEFGIPDPDLGFRDEDEVTLGQVAGVGETICYRYDFGDSWNLVIKVERAVAPGLSASYPRCVGGKRAAPPADCGGIRGYEHLVEVLADPEHPEREDILSWLELQSGDQFVLSAFESRAVNAQLALRLSRV